jgi:hypothetical protein
MKKTLMISLVAAVGLFAFGGNFGFYKSGASQSSASQTQKGLTKTEINALKYMYEEEKLAKDVYYTLGKKFPNLSVFSRIAKAERIHENSVANVMKRYGIPLPERGNEVGKFTNPHLQELYDNLVKMGEKSPENALKAGIMVEVTDIEDLDKYLKTAKSPDVKALFSFLRSGSYNHYNAFNWYLKNVTGKGACDLMDKRWCHNYPFQRGVGRYYRNWYWFAPGGFNK